ncbi:uncharacterized protein LOC109285942 [Alligator mississippiensis]|uniref:uncharacterized protein LOC109285942 n=1 Tax=Alligator mississippiensis TaxID=8496 RepID=UPI002877F058|nr:uncharacterized protein LOC109285942 [Alligator mississippiensis]
MWLLRPRHALKVQGKNSKWGFFFTAPILLIPYFVLFWLEILPGQLDASVSILQLAQTLPTWMGRQGLVPVLQLDWRNWYLFAANSSGPGCDCLPLCCGGRSPGCFFLRCLVLHGKEIAINFILRLPDTPQPANLLPELPHLCLQILLMKARDVSPLPALNPDCRASHGLDVNVAVVGVKEDVVYPPPLKYTCSLGPCAMDLVDGLLLAFSTPEFPTTLRVCPDDPIPASCSISNPFEMLHEAHAGMGKCSSFQHRGKIKPLAARASVQLTFALALKYTAWQRASSKELDPGSTASK